jgi:hypothetical protein
MGKKIAFPKSLNLENNYMFRTNNINSQLENTCMGISNRLGKGIPIGKFHIDTTYIFDTLQRYFRIEAHNSGAGANF